MTRPVRVPVRPLPPSIAAIDMSSYSNAQLQDLAKLRGPIAYAAQARLAAGGNPGIPDGAAAVGAGQLLVGQAIWATLNPDQQAALAATSTAQAAAVTVAEAEAVAQTARTGALTAIANAQASVAPVIGTLPVPVQAAVAAAQAAAEQATTSLQAAQTAGQAASDHTQAAVDAAVSVAASVLPGQIAADNPPTP